MHHRSYALLALVLAFAVGLCLVPATAAADDGPATAEKAKPEAKKAEAKVKRRPMLWMIEGTPRVYLFGTIHVPHADVVTHLPVVQQALDQSTAVYTELDLDPQTQMQKQMEVFQAAAMPDKTLAEVFGGPLYDRVAKLVPKQMPYAMLSNTKPWLTQFLLLQTLMGEHNAKEQREAARAKEEAMKKDGAGESAAPAAAPAAKVALDQQLYADAKKAGKKVGGLETLMTQIKPFNALSIETQVKMVKSLVEEIEKLRAEVKKEEAPKDEKSDEKNDEKDGEAKKGRVDRLGDMVDMWLAGDADGFLTILQRDLNDQAPDEAEAFIKGILDDRNVGMVAKIQELMKADPKQTYFIAVGGGHMPGKMGVVSLLKKAGLTVKRVELGAKLPAVAKAEPAPVK